MTLTHGLKIRLHIISAKTQAESQLNRLRCTILWSAVYTLHVLPVADKDKTEQPDEPKRRIKRLQTSQLYLPPLGYRRVICYELATQTLSQNIYVTAPLVKRAKMATLVAKKEEYLPARMPSRFD